MVSRYGKLNPDSGFTYLADRVPTPKKTGNFLTDSSAEGRCLMFREIISECELDTATIPAMFTCLKKRKRELMKEMMAAEELEAFTPIGRWEDDFVVEWLVQVSDAARPQILKACEEDEDAIKLLRCFGTQMHDSLIYPKDGKHKTVAIAMLNAFHDKLGKPLKEIVKKKILLPSGALDFSTIGYSLDFKGGDRAKTITHGRSLDVQTIPEHVIITKAHVVQFNHSDWLAAAALPPLDPIPFHSFFRAGKTGPYEHQVLRGQVKEFSVAVKQQAVILGKTPTSVSYASASSSSAAAAPKASAKASVAKARSEKKKNAMAKARVNAKTALDAKKQKRTFTASKLDKKDK